ncbi:DUF2268 domain-containing protein [Radiobacillus deserti]|uniref:DUF2268 domain-containing protein n=1 Tax=Radiobacillus deserti TaxID=2594883 RepID=A0A516KIH7_9BACI|nr:DUF2268 domain-containing putative Zn-dependent protease [Radiobacillus deserti]QDP41189.1 hypothetical protein FN924_13945 [Radiobacillus deserti]
MKKKWLVLMWLWLPSLLLLGCTNENSNGKTEVKTSPDVPVTFEYKQQEYEIRNFYDELLEYAEKADSQSDQLNEIYREHVLEPFRIHAFGEMGGYSAISSWHFAPPEDIKELEEDIKALKKRKNKINTLIIEALKESADKLPPDEGKTIYLFPANYSVPGLSYSLPLMGGVTGRVWNEDFVFFRLDPSFEKESLQYMIAHEYHHTVNFEKSKENHSETLLEAVMIEGKAELFAETVYPDVEVSWSKPFISQQSEQKVWNYLKENQNLTNVEIKSEFTNGNPRKNLPQWSLYRIGKRIMEIFVDNNPDISIQDWTKLPAREILSKSKYEEKFK